MFPFVRDGDELIVATTPGAPISVGDIVLYRSPVHSHPIAHRVVGLRGVPPVFIVRADAYPTMTETVPQNSIIGRVDYLRRNDAVIRVGGTRTAALVNQGVARYYPALLSAKETLARILAPGLACVQRLTLYKVLASRFLTTSILVNRQADTDEVRIMATVNGRYAGHADIHLQCLEGRRIGWVTAVYVRVRYRGAGIGTRLIEAAEKHAEHAGIRELRLEYDQGNRAAERLYRKLEFRVVAPDVAENRTGGIVLHKIVGRVSLP